MRVRLSRLALASVLVLALPAGALAISLMTAGGFNWDPTETGNGALIDGTSDAYDGCYYLDVNGTTYEAGGMPATLGLGGRLVVMAEQSVGSLMVHREFYAPASGGDWGRYADVIRNGGATAVDVTVRIWGNLGSDGGETIYADASGDGAFTIEDDWFGTDDMDGMWDPSLGHIVQGPGASVRATSAMRSGDNIEWSFRTTVPAGATVVFVTFAIQKMNRAEAQAETMRLVSLPDEAQAGLEPWLGDLANFAGAVACTGTAGATCTGAAGVMGRCYAGRCCTGCWDGTRCQSGRTGVHCGVAGGACRSCVDGVDCSSDVCTAGVCSNPDAPAGTACNDGMFCTTSDVCDGRRSCAGVTGMRCDDMRSCTTDVCDEATDSCSTAMTTGCNIGGECVATGARHVSSPCLVCDPTRSMTDWSPAMVGMPCGTASCTAGRLRAAPTCSATGTCVATPSMPCPSGACASGTECAPACASDAECDATERCAMGRCTPRSPLGAPCSSADQCASNACSDGVCCDNACDGLCESCDLAASAGTCTSRPAGTDPESECPTGSCDGAGACMGTPGVDAGPPAGDSGPVATRDSGPPVTVDAGPIDPTDDGRDTTGGCGCTTPTHRASAPATLLVLALALVAAALRLTLRRRQQVCR